MKKSVSEESFSKVAVCSHTCWRCLSNSSEQAPKRLSIAFRRPASTRPSPPTTPVDKHVHLGGDLRHSRFSAVHAYTSRTWGFGGLDISEYHYTDTSSPKCHRLGQSLHKLPDQHARLTSMRSRYTCLTWITYNHLQYALCLVLSLLNSHCLHVWVLLDAAC